MISSYSAHSASDQAAYEVAEYVMKLRTAVTEFAGERTVSELIEAVGTESAYWVEELWQAEASDYWNTRIRPALIKLDH